MMKLLFAILKISGLPFLFRELLQRNKVTILVFHDMNPKAAARNFEYLSKKYNIIELNEFIDACKNKDKTKLPPKALIITFDDGHIGNFDLLPIIKQYHIPVTIFLCAAIIDTKRHYWFKFSHPSISVQELKRKPNRERLQILANAGFEPEKVFDFPQALSRTQMAAMQPYINFQAHTLSHPCLPQCSDAEAKQEIFCSKEKLEKNFGLKINALAYPNGDYTERDVELTRSAGYDCGLTIDAGFNTIDTDLFKLKRLDPNDTDDRNELIVKSSGVWDFFKTIFKQQ